MGAEDITSGGEVVYLLAELRPEVGRIEPRRQVRAEGGEPGQTAKLVSLPMRPSADIPTDDIVYLLAELRCEENGAVLEIGSRARVLERDGDRVTLAVAHGNEEDVVTCSRALVARRERSFTGRRALRASARPAF